MSANNTSSEEKVDSTSVDSFIKELEEKEKDLDISSDLVIEVDESEVEHDNIRDSFLDVEIVEPANEIEPSTESKLNDIDLLPGESGQVMSDEQVEKVTKELEELKEAYIRQKRDFDNFRNRTARERTETFSNVVCNVAAEILPILDNLGRALDSLSSDEATEKSDDFQRFFEGVGLVNQQITDVLAGMGVQAIPAVGEKFNPEYHEAVEIVEDSDSPPDTIVFEILKGYKVDEKVIRASMVRVSSANSPDQEVESEDILETP